MHPSLCLLSLLALTSANHTTLQILEQFHNFCSNKTEIFKCLKIQSLKLMDRALHSKSIGIIEGVTFISTRKSRTFKQPLNDTKLEKLSSKEIGGMLEDTTSKFFQSHKFEVDVFKLVEEGRRKREKGGWGALLAALALKGTFMAVMYQGIAVISGTAIIVGKIALILAAILGLKKLVSSGHEKTSIEIVKIPKYSKSSHEDDDHYHRALDLDLNKWRAKM